MCITAKQLVCQEPDVNLMYWFCLKKLVFFDKNIAAVSFKIPAVLLLMYSCILTGISQKPFGWIFLYFYGELPLQFVTKEHHSVCVNPPSAPALDNVFAWILLTLTHGEWVRGSHRRFIIKKFVKPQDLRRCDKLVNFYSFVGLNLLHRVANAAIADPATMYPVAACSL